MFLRPVNLKPKIFWINIFRQHAASIYGFVRQLVLSEKICVSVRWVTLWVRPPLPVRSFDITVGARVGESRGTWEQGSHKILRSPTKF